MPGPARIAASKKWRKPHQGKINNDDAITELLERLERALEHERDEGHCEVFLNVKRAVDFWWGTTE